jgi:hypothetical protein
VSGQFGGYLTHYQNELDYIERIDRLTTVAEGRRNATLREIDHRRAILGETLRRSAQEIEADEFKVIEGKNALDERLQN